MTDKENQFKSAQNDLKSLLAPESVQYKNGEAFHQVAVNFILGNADAIEKALTLAAETWDCGVEKEKTAPQGMGALIALAIVEQELNQETYIKYGDAAQQGYPSYKTKLEGELEWNRLQCEIIRRALSRQSEQQAAIKTINEWYEDFGTVLWFDEDFNGTHEIYCGCPLSSDWPWDEKFKGQIFWMKAPNIDFKTHAAAIKDKQT